MIVSRTLDGQRSRVAGSSTIPKTRTMLTSKFKKIGGFRWESPCALTEYFGGRQHGQDLGSASQEESLKALAGEVVSRLPS